MEYRIEKKKSFKVIGIGKEFSLLTSSLEIPKFWDEVFKMKSLEEVFLKFNIGEYGICINGIKADTFQYMIAGLYQGGDIPEGLEVFEFPETLWAKFQCVGKMPEAIQALNTKIRQEWIPQNKEYMVDNSYDIEWYSRDYIQELWIPVIKKE